MTDQKKPEVLHRTQFAGGRETPEEMHRRVAWNSAKCLCGGPAVVRVRVFAEADYLVQRKPEFIMALAARNGGNIPMANFKHGKFVRVSEAFACSNDKATALKSAAHHPSWMFVEIDEGPKNSPQIQVA